MKGVVGITGTPGTGKKSVAPLVASKLSLPCLSINEFAKSHGLVGLDGDVDTTELRMALAASLKASAVVHGHLLPYSLDPSRVSRAVVLRCEPSILKQRLRARGYPQAKVAENVEAELIGLVSADSFRAFGRTKTVELDATYAEPEGAAVEIVSLLRNPKSRPTIEWMNNYDTGPSLRSLLSPG